MHTSYFKRLLIGALLVTGLAQAAAIQTFNTGVDATGTVLANGTLGDPHYTLALTPGGTSAVRVITSANGFPIGPWIGDNTASRWIGPDNDGFLDGPVGTYDYRTTFDLTGFNPSTAALAGRWSTDNPGVDILINGVSTGNTSCCLDQWTSFSITSGFQSGVNELIFRLVNQGGPTGLRVEYTGSADANSPVPEPASFLLVGMTLVGANVIRRRMRRSA